MNPAVRVDELDFRQRPHQRNRLVHIEFGGEGVMRPGGGGAEDETGREGKRPQLR
jgi:hypothetical protein